VFFERKKIMTFEELMDAFDRAMSEGNTVFAEELLLDNIKAAADRSNDGLLLQLLNEYIGFLRGVGRHEDSYKIAQQIISLSDYMGLKGSIPYATSLLNIATAYRAGGRLTESLGYYDEVERIYLSSEKMNPMLLAGYYNNKSLLFQEMGQYENSVECLRKALEIVEAEKEGYEIAVTHTNLANSYVGMQDYIMAQAEAEKAVEVFEAIKATESHCASALYILGLCAIERRDGVKATDLLTRALKMMEESLGKTEYYYRIKDAQERASKIGKKGMDLCREYYAKIVAPAIAEKFPEYVDKIAAGLVGRGSDCYGYDDAYSRDHDWGPGCLLFVSSKTYSEIGEALEEMYASLPEDYKGYKKGATVSKNKRRGVFTIDEFYKSILGVFPVTAENFITIPDYALSSAVNGAVFTDPEGFFTEIRNELMKGYPENVLFLKIAEAAAQFSQGAQYNYKRFMDRGDTFTASIMLSDGLKAAMKLAHYIENKYPPHDKWLRRSCEDLEMGPELMGLLTDSVQKGNVDALGEFLAFRMYEKTYISDVDDYLDHHCDELVLKAEISKKTDEELARLITDLEFEAFDKVQNEGGRASCQDDDDTFTKMRESQYYTWNRTMLLQYYYDFQRELSYGHNLITEKYGRMMKSTAPKKYEKIKDNFPEITEEKAAIIEAIVAIQVKWMEDFAANYPKLADNARSIHTYEDNILNTSYETYLRGEISTYSDKMLELYGRFIAGLMAEGRNLAYETMENSVHFYGYESLDAAEAKK